MKKPREKRTRTVAEASDLLLIEQIEARLALAREITQLATELRTYVVEIERTLRRGRVDNVVRFRAPIN